MCCLTREYRRPMGGTGGHVGLQPFRPPRISSVPSPCSFGTPSPGGSPEHRWGDPASGPCVTRCPAAVLALALVLGAPWQALHGAPLAELSGDHDFQLFLHKNLEFTRKIRGDVAALQRAVVSAPITPPSPPSLIGTAGPWPAASPHPRHHPWTARSSPCCAPSPLHAVSSGSLSCAPADGWGGSHIPRGVAGLWPSHGASGSAALTVCPLPQCDTFQLCTEEELQLVQPDPHLVQAPLDQCHKRGFQAVSAGTHP